MELKISIKILRGPSFYYFLRKCSLFYLVKVSKKIGGKDLLINLLVYLSPYFYKLFYFF